jgi:hypothetical protein
LTRKFSRTALAAGISIAAAGISALPANAAVPNAVSTPNYYVKSPAIGDALSITPESAVVSGVIDTGGDPVSYLPVPTGGLTWDGDVAIAAGANVAGDPNSGQDVPVDGIPASGSYPNVSVTVTDSGTTRTLAASNAGADNFSTVTFAYDPASDYEAAGNQPGPNTQYGTGVNIPTTTGLSSVSTKIGAFGQAAQANSGNKPLRPGTKYYFWLQQQAGGTDAATNVNLAGWEGLPANPTDVCLPNDAIAQDATVSKLASNTSATAVTADGTQAAGTEGQCNYYFGDTAGGPGLQSPTGAFSTPALGKLVIGKQAKVNGRKATVSVADSSAYNASGTIELDDSAGDTLATGKFGVRAGHTGSAKLTLTSAGVTAAGKHKAGVLSLTSNWDQSTATKKITLLGAKKAKK